MDKLQSIKLQDNEELMFFDVSALFTSIPVNQALDVINDLIIQHQTDMDSNTKLVSLGMKLLITLYFPFRESFTNKYTVLQCIVHVCQ